MVFLRKLTVEDNIRAVLELQYQDGKSLSRALIESRLNALLADLQVEKLRTSPALSLSGGERRRVEIARALATKPRFLLLDEPFASLDTELRQRLAMDVRLLLKQQGTAALLVTHDQHEAFAMADRVGLLAGGRLQQWDTPYALYHEPANRTVAGFIGEGVFIPATVISEHCLQLPFGEFCRLHDLPMAGGSEVSVLVRPDDVLHDDASGLRAQVISKQFRGADYLYTLQLDGGAQVLSLVPSHHEHAVGEVIGIRMAFDHLITFACD